MRDETEQVTWVVWKGLECWVEELVLYHDFIGKPLKHVNRVGTF